MKKLTCPQCKTEFAEAEIRNPYYPAHKCPGCGAQKYVDGSWWPATTNIFYLHQKNLKAKKWCPLHPHAWFNPIKKDCQACIKAKAQRLKNLPSDTDDFTI